MRKFILIFLAILPLIMGCSDKGKVIPEEELSEIFFDMFLADQWLRDHPEYRDKADTTLFFEPIFRKYGYSFKDYNASLDYYATDTDMLARVTMAASTKMKETKDHYEALVEHNREVRLENERLMVDYVETDFSSDSLVWHTGKVRWPEFVEPAQQDSVVTADTLEVPELERDLGVKVEQAELKLVKPDARFEKEIKKNN